MEYHVRVHDEDTLELDRNSYFRSTKNSVDDAARGFVLHDDNHIAAGGFRVLMEALEIRDEDEKEVAHHQTVSSRPACLNFLLVLLRVVGFQSSPKGYSLGNTFPKLYSAFSVSCCFLSVSSHAIYL